MPSHIFTRVGAWGDSVTTNRRSADAAQRSNDPDDALHALDYMTYAYLQLARDGDARKTTRRRCGNPARLLNAPDDRDKGPTAVPATLAVSVNLMRRRVQISNQCRVTQLATQPITGYF